jgi:HlyD family secretion protein
LRTVLVTAISGGQVAELAAGDGDGAMVAAGTPLARLSNPSLELDVASRCAEIVGQLSAISGHRLSVENTRQDGARDLAEARNAL